MLVTRPIIINLLADTDTQPSDVHRRLGDTPVRLVDRLVDSDYPPVVSQPLSIRHIADCKDTGRYGGFFSRT